MTPRTVTLPSGVCVCLDPNCTIPYGTCHCGCQQKTPIAISSYLKRHHVKGMPRMYLKSHQFVRPRQDLRSAQPFKLNGVYCRLIPLTKGFWTIVWQSDYEWLMQRLWYASQCAVGYYARARDSNGKFVGMHQLLLPLPAGMEVDHINGNSLDNRRDNLRPATRGQQAKNKKRYRNNTTGEKGVTICGGQIRARISVDGVRIELKHDGTKAGAANAYKQAAAKHFGKFAR
jgi:HNH endonuclease